jgi:hypothetical protein
MYYKTFPRQNFTILKSFKVGETKIRRFVKRIANAFTIKSNDAKSRKTILK